MKHWQAPPLKSSGKERTEARCYYYHIHTTLHTDHFHTKNSFYKGNTIILIENLLSSFYR